MDADGVWLLHAVPWFNVLEQDARSAMHAVRLEDDEIAAREDLCAHGPEGGLVRKAKRGIQNLGSRVVGVRDGRLRR